MIKIPFDNSYAALGNDFYVKTKPTPVSNPELITFNSQLADELGLADANLDTNNAVEFFSGNKIAEGSEPLAMAYAGHQFGGFNPQLGDGRAIQLGEIIGTNNIRYDLQLKGSGPTHFSRGGDGRSALGPVLREYLVSEAMHKLGLPTTRALAAVTTGEEVARTQLVAGGIITRVATSFVRVGTFQFFAGKNNNEWVKQLADYVIDRNYPEIKHDKNPYESFLKAVINRQAKLIAQWMHIGFIHGVMNTDNVSVVGETIDYGPCAFMDEFDHNRLYSSIDRKGRYAYSNQASIGQWNLIRLAETLLPFIGKENDAPEAAVEIAQSALNDYIELYKGYWLKGIRNKLGLATELESDKALIDELLNVMQENKADFTLTFYYLSHDDDDALRHLFSKPDDIDDWLITWRQRLLKETLSKQERQANMLAVNPVYIPRNHQIEAAIRAAEDHNDFSVFHKLHQVLQKPYERQTGCESYMLPPKPDEVVQQTFCGT